MERTKVFISYSHKDEDFLAQLKVHLKLLERQGIVNSWDDKRIKAGQDWKAEIDRALSEARVAILLVSADFLASDFIYEDELPPILLAQEEEGLQVLPVILRPCLFEMTPLSRFQAINSPDRPLLGLSELELGNVWVRLATRVVGILKEKSRKSSKNTGKAIGGEKESVIEPTPLTSSDVSNSIPVTAIDVRDLKLEAMRAEIGGDIGKATGLWRQILAKIPSDSEATVQLTRLEQLSGTAKLDSSRPVEPKNFSENLGGGVTLEMIAIPGGGFWMGSPEREEGRNDYDSPKDADVEGPQHRVTLEPFWLGMYPVTQAQWMEVAALPKVEVEMKPQPSKFFGLEHPVETISWYEAVEFCERLSGKTGRNYRLPREAEWEYACRAGTITPFSFGESISTDLANYLGLYVYGQGKKGEYRGQTTSVGSFQANAFGLYDMHGNVWEWCADWWQQYLDHNGPTPRDFWIEKHSRVLRGGSWYTAPADIRSARRGKQLLHTRNEFIGFRVVCS